MVRMQHWEEVSVNVYCHVAAELGQKVHEQIMVTADRFA